MSFFDPMLQQSKIFLEAGVPGSNTGVDSSEVFIISLFPQAPSSDQKYLSEEGVMPIRLDVLE